MNDQQKSLINKLKKFMNDQQMEQLVEKQSELIQLLEGQITDLTMMSKIELGDDVIAEVWRLTKAINALKESVKNKQ